MKELDLENVDGFIINLGDVGETRELLQDILCGDDKEYNIVSQWDMWRIREYLLNYFIETYKTVLVKAPNVYQIIEEELYTKGE